VYNTSVQVNNLVINYYSIHTIMRTVHIGLASLFLFAALLIAPLAFADDDNKGKSEDNNRGRQSFSLLPFLNLNLGTTSAALQLQIKSLQEALANLKAQREALDDNRASTTKAARDGLKIEIKETRSDINRTERQLRFARSLSRGMSGDDVRDLQELLAQDSSIFSSSFITGFFGPKTEEALRKFQKKFGIDAIGIFGPKTQAKLLALFFGRELPPGIIKRLGLETSTTTPGQGIVTVCHNTGTSGAKQTLVIAVPALGAHLAHGDTVGVCPGSGTATTTPQ